MSPQTYACLFAPAWFVLQKEHWHACVSEYRYINKRSAEQSASRFVAQFNKLRFAHCKDMNWLRRGGGPRAAAATQEKNHHHHWWWWLLSNFGITFGSFWNHFGVILGSLSGYFGVMCLGKFIATTFGLFGPYLEDWSLDGWIDGSVESVGSVGLVAPMGSVTSVVVVGSVGSATDYFDRPVCPKYWFY